MDQNLLRHFQKHQIDYQAYQHPAVFTVEEANKVDRNIPALHTKNLFLKEKTGQYYLVCLEAQKRLDIKNLSQTLSAKKLSFAKPEELKAQLNLTPGNVSLFGMIYSSTVRLVLDQDILNAPKVGFHPNLNTATLVIDQNGLQKFLASLNLTPTIVHISQNQAV